MVHVGAVFITCKLLFLSFLQWCILSFGKEVEGLRRNCHHWWWMCGGQCGVSPSQRWHEGCGAAGEVWADSWIHLARCTSDKVYFFMAECWSVKVKVKKGCKWQSTPFYGRPRWSVSQDLCTSIALGFRLGNSGQVARLTFRPMGILDAMFLAVGGNWNTCKKRTDKGIACKLHTCFIV